MDQNDIETAQIILMHSKLGISNQKPDFITVSWEALNFYEYFMPLCLVVLTQLVAVEVGRRHLVPVPLVERQ